MSPAQLYCAIEGRRELREFEQRQGWEQARYIAKAIVSVQVQRKDKHLLEKAFALPWDNEDNGTNVAGRKLSYSEEDVEEMERIAIRDAERMNKQIQKNGIS